MSFTVLVLFSAARKLMRSHGAKKFLGSVFDTFITLSPVSVALLRGRIIEKTKKTLLWLSRSAFDKAVRFVWPGNSSLYFPRKAYCKKK